MRDPDSGVPLVKMLEEPPTVRGVLGQEMHHPEFVGTTCERCEESGYVNDSVFYGDRDPKVLCDSCHP